MKASISKTSKRLLSNNRTKTLMYLTGLSILCLFIVLACKKDETGESDGEVLTEEGMAFKSFQIMNLASDRMIELGESMDVDPRQALYFTMLELQDNEDVEQIEFRDSTYLAITTTGGFSVTVSLNEVDEDGTSVYRGSSNGTSELKQFYGSAGGSCTNEIPNKKVLLFAADHNDFYKGNEFQTRVVDVIKNLEPEAEVVVRKDAQCNPELMETFDQYGLVILDAHGEREGVSTGLVLSFNYSEIPGSRDAFINILKNKLGTKNYNSYLSKRLKIRLDWIFNPVASNQETWNSYKAKLIFDYDVVMTSKGVRDLLPDLSNTVVFANNCYSGFGNSTYTIHHNGRTYTYTYDGIGSAWLEKDLISLYAYQATLNIRSYKAPDNFCKLNEDTLIHSFFSDGDSTGLAHKLNGTTLSQVPWSRDIGGRFNSGPLVFKQFGQVNWCYQGCQETFVDERDMREYRSVCIGDQTWMAENLKYAGAGGVCYEFEAELCESHGRMYRLGELTNYQTSTDSTVVRGLCPEGWHVPSLAEYQKLFETVGGISTAGPKLMAPDYWEKPNNYTDEFDFNLRPGGYYIYDENDPEPYNWSVGGFGAAFWTSSPGNNPEDYYSIEVNEYAEIYAEIIPLYPELGYERGATCRCVKDK